jgi:serine/threonine protein phosphatase PrpC
MSGMNARLITARLVVPSAGVGQDRAEVFETSDGLVIIVVADGAGGTAGGAEAADHVVEAVRKAVASPDGRQLDPYSLLRDIDRDLASHGGETTAVVAIVSASGIVGASVGDSGAWLVRPDGHLDLTSQQIRKPLLGSRCARPVRFRSGALDGTLVVATDGLLKYAKLRDICAKAHDTDLAAVPDGLVRLVRLQGGGLQDDVAIVVCRPIG